MQLLDHIKNGLLYGGLTKEEFHQVKEPVRERNRITLIVWSIASGLFYIAAAFLYNALEKPLGAGILVVTLATSAITLTCALFFSKRHPWLVTVAMYLLELSILGNGVALSVYHSPNRDCGTIVLAALLPSAFTDRTIASIALEAVTIIGYIIVGQCGLIAPDVAVNDGGGILAGGDSGNHIGDLLGGHDHISGGELLGIDSLFQQLVTEQLQFHTVLVDGE